MTLKNDVVKLYHYVKPEVSFRSRMTKKIVRKVGFVIAVWMICEFCERHGIFHRFGRTSELIMTAVTDHYMFDSKE